MFFVFGWMSLGLLSQSIYNHRLFDPSLNKDSSRSHIRVVAHTQNQIGSNVLMHQQNLGFTSSFEKNKLSVQGLYALQYLKTDLFQTQFIQEFNTLPSNGVFHRLNDSTSFLGHLFKGSLTYEAFEFLSLSINHNTLRLDDGYRSLWMGNHNSPFWHFKIDAQFGDAFRYQSIVARFKDRNPLNPSRFGSTKFGAFHVLSASIRKKLHFHFFESVIWGAKDSLNHRNFDARYLNPVIFYRPVEYGIGSADNSFMGASIQYQPSKRFEVYTQLILDEFFLKEIRSRQGWWANKYGLQLGSKLYFELPNNKQLQLQAEANTVRPFTYAHLRSLESYTHHNQSIAHPLGANFREIVGLATLKTKKSIIDAKAIYYEKGLDVNGMNMGGNPLRNYLDRSSDYGHNTLQGTLSKVLWLEANYYYRFSKKIPLFVFGGGGVRMHNLSENTAFIQIGLSTLHFQTDHDYY